MLDYLVLLKLINLLSKSVLLTKLACFNLAAKFSAVNFLSSWVVIHLKQPEILLSNSLIFVLRILVVTNLLVSGIFYSTSLIFVFKTVVVTIPLVSGIFSTTSLIFSLNFVYLCYVD